MFCPNCGANISGEFEVCPECGTGIYVTRSNGAGKNDPFIVAGDPGEVQTSFGSVISVPEDESNSCRPAIIEAEEDELPEGKASTVLTPSGSYMTDRVIFGGDSPSDGFVAALNKENDPANVPSAVDTESGTGSEQILPSGASLPDGGPSHDQSPIPLVVGISDGGEIKTPPSASYPYTDLPSPSRRRPVIAGLAVIIFVVLGIAILIYGVPGQGSEDAGVPILTPQLNVLPDITPIPVTETPPPWTPSENLILSVSAYGGGYKVEIDGGLMANEVATILMTVEDTGGLHTMEWVYPSRHESYYMAREAYNGTASAIEHVTATATYTDGKKEVVFSGDL